MILLIFEKGGLVAFEPDHQYWFLQVFCKRMKSIEGVRICVLNATEYRASVNFVIDTHDNISGKLKYTEMLEAASEHLTSSKDPASFCLGAMEPASKDIDYYEFAKRLTAAREFPE